MSFFRKWDRERFRFVPKHNLPLPGDTLNIYAKKGSFLHWDGQENFIPVLPFLAGKLSLWYTEKVLLVGRREEIL